MVPVPRVPPLGAPPPHRRPDWGSGARAAEHARLGTSGARAWQPGVVLPAPSGGARRRSPTLADGGAPGCDHSSQQVGFGALLQAYDTRV